MDKRIIRQHNKYYKLPKNGNNYQKDLWTPLNLPKSAKCLQNLQKFMIKLKIFWMLLG